MPTLSSVSAVGFSQQSTAPQLFTWACNSARLDWTYVYDATLESSPSPTISYWADSQGMLLDFLSEVSAFFLHLFYVNNKTLVAVDMANDNGSRALDGYDFLPSEYSYVDPPSLVKSTWTVREAVMNEDGKYVDTVDREASVDGTYDFGSEVSITPYHDDITTVTGYLTSIKDLLEKAEINVVLPMATDLPVPGEALTITDADSFDNSLTIAMHCRSLTYDFINMKVQVTGEGTIT